MVFGCPLTSSGIFTHFANSLSVIIANFWTMTNQYWIISLLSLEEDKFVLNPFSCPTLTFSCLLCNMQGWENLVLITATWVCKRMVRMLLLYRNVTFVFIYLSFCYLNLIFFKEHNNTLELRAVISRMIFNYWLTETMVASKWSQLLTRRTWYIANYINLCNINMLTSLTDGF